MKLTNLFAVAIITVAIASCNNEESTMPQNDRVAVQFGSSIKASTRAVDETWTSGDPIGIFMTKAGETLSDDAICEEANNVAYQTTEGNGAFTPVVETEIIYYPMDGDVDFYAYYPYTEVTNYVVNLNVSNQNNQETLDFMYATARNCNKSTPQVTLDFNHQLSNLILEVQPGEGLTQEDLAALTVKVKEQNTTGSYNLVDGLISNEGTPADIAMKTIVAGKKYVAILLPETSDSREIEFNLNNGKDAPFTWTMTGKLEGNKKYHYTTMKLSRTAAEGSGTIKPWEQAGDSEEHEAK